MRLVLASASPRRADLLTSAGFAFETLAVDADERTRPGEAPTAYVRRLAGEKSARALDVLSGSNPTGMDVPGRPRPGDGGAPEFQQRWTPGANAVGTGDIGGADDPASGVSGIGLDCAIVGERDIVVLGADTAVVLDGVILGKPRDDEDARAMLRRLSGRRHEVLTGVSLRIVGEERGLVETTSVWFNPLTPDVIAWYVLTGEGRDKAGAYAIQGLASRLIPRIEGSYSNVVGLPVAAVVGLLRELNRTPPG